MSQKPQRWYEIIDGVLYVYDNPYPQQATGVSVTKPDDLPYYRNNFNLARVWASSKFHPNDFIT